jgi:MFS family permease
MPASPSPTLTINPNGTLPRAWLVVSVLWVVAALNYLDRNMVTTMRYSLNEVIPMSEKQFGWVTTSFLLVYGLLSPVGGFLADRFNRSRLIMGSLLVWSLLTWLTGHVKTYEQLIWVRALMGMSEAAYIPAALALIADYHRGSTRSLAAGIHMIGISVGSLLGGYGGWIAEKFGWSFPFDLCGIFGVVYAGVLLLTLRDVPREQVGTVAASPEAAQPRVLEAISALMRNGSFLLLIAFWSLLAVAGWALVGWLPVYFKEKFHLSQGIAGIYATNFLFVAAFFGKLVSGVWADYWSRTNPRGRILVPVIGLCVAAPSIAVVAGSPVLYLALVGLSIYGFTRTFSDTNLMPILCQVVDPRYRATGYGFLNMFATIVGGITILLGGVLRDAKVSVGVLFTGAGIGLLFCAGILFMVKTRAVVKVSE